MKGKLLVAGLLAVIGYNILRCPAPKTASNHEKDSVMIENFWKVIREVNDIQYEELERIVMTERVRIARATSYLQGFLKIEDNGRYDDVTWDAVKAFQTRYNKQGFKPRIKVDGMFGQELLNAMENVYKARGYRDDIVMGWLGDAAARNIPLHRYPNPAKDPLEHGYDSRTTEMFRFFENERKKREDGNKSRSDSAISDIMFYYHLGLERDHNGRRVSR